MRESMLGLGADTPAPQPAGPENGRLRIGRADYLIAAAFVAYALLFTFDCGREIRPYPFLGFDAADIATLAAVQDRPELFEGDQVWGDPRHYQLYQTMHAPIIRWLKPLWGDYGSAYFSLLPIHIIIQALGFYILGRVLFAQRYWAVLLAIINLAPIWLGFGTYWGIDADPRPRFTFQALLPFLLAATLSWRDTPRRWPWLMVGIGLLIYAHPVSTPGWAFALWLSLLFARPDRVEWSRHLLYLLLLGFLFLAVITPFAINYYQNHSHGEAAGADFDQVNTLMHEIYGVEYLDIPNGLRRFVRRWSKYKLLFWVFAMAGGAYLALKARQQRDRLRMIISWATGIGLINVALPYIEQRICRAMGILPYEIDLIRGVRYFVPMMLIFCLWPLAVADRPGGDASKRRLALRCAGALLVGIWLFYHPPLHNAPWRQWWGTEGLCRPVDARERFEALEAVRENTPVKSRMMTEARELDGALRYYVHRPLVFAYQDHGFLSYTDPPAFLKWGAVREEILDIRSMEAAEQRFGALCHLATGLDAEYLLLRSEDTATASGSRCRVIWRNSKYTLLAIAPSRAVSTLPDS